MGTPGVTAVAAMAQVGTEVSMEVSVGTDMSSQAGEVMEEGWVLADEGLMVPLTLAAIMAEAGQEEEFMEVLEKEM